MIKKLMVTSLPDSVREIIKRYIREDVDMEEMHVLLRNRGKIIPTDAKSYMSVGGYVALKKRFPWKEPKLFRY